MRVESFILGAVLGFLASIITDSYGVDAITSPKWWCTILLLVIMSAVLREDV